MERCLYANELGDGLLFSYLFKGRHAYVGQADEWIWWSGHHWSVDLIEKGHRARADVEHVAQAYYTTGAHFDRLAKDAERDGDKESAGRLKAKAEKMKAGLPACEPRPGASAVSNLPRPTWRARWPSLVMRSTETRGRCPWRMALWTCARGDAPGPSR